MSAPAPQIEGLDLSPYGEQHTKQQPRDVGYDFRRIPVPKYRHAAPSAPWPWMDVDINASEVRRTSTRQPDESEWARYPQSLFQNWTNEQVDRCQILTKCSDRPLSTIYKLSAFDDGSFDERVEVREVCKDNDADLQAYWRYLEVPPPSNVRVQALFIEEMTLPILKMLGTRYNVEPFFFASSVNWIPSRYREDRRALEDHITVVLPFIRVIKKGRPPITRAKPLRIPTSASIESLSYESAREPLSHISLDEEQIIDAQSPLSLPGNNFLAQDLLSCHMIRKPATSTIISYHPSLRGTSAKRLQSLVKMTGHSTYWSKIFGRSRDPTFLFLAILWYALYAWDETFEVLFRYINALEYNAAELRGIRLTRELHKLQEHLAYYEQLLLDFLKSVEFVRNTSNPAMNAHWISEAERESSAKLLRTEADNLTTEIIRLTQQRSMLTARLDSAIHLTFATLNIQDARTMQRLAEVTVRDSGALKQIAYLSTVFLPATYLSNAFSMNIREFNPPSKVTLAHYVGAAIGLTFFTSWLIITLQKDSTFFPDNSGFLRRTLWPIFYTYDAILDLIKWLETSGRRSTHSAIASSTSTPRSPIQPAMLYSVLEKTGEECHSS